MENKKYDLEKAKEDCRRHEDALEEAQSCMCGHCHECGFDPSEMKAALDEVERLRSENRELKKTDGWANDVIKEHESLNARINGLEAEAQEYHDKKEEALTLCAGQNRYIERLEAAFLGATKEIVYAIHEGRDAPEGEDVYAEKVAREALEQLRAEDKIGGGDGE